MNSQVVEQPSTTKEEQQEQGGIGWGRKILHEPRMSSRKRVKVSKYNCESRPKQSLQGKATSPTPLPEHPLCLNPEYLRIDFRTGIGLKSSRRAPKDVKINEQEKASVREVFKLLLQAYHTFKDGPGPEPLDNRNDISWDWQSRGLTRDAYGKLLYIMSRKEWYLEYLPYDWIPNESGAGTINIRKECSYQSDITSALSSQIHNAIFKHGLSRRLGLQEGPQLETRASVLVGNQVGMRTPCRCFRFDEKNGGNLSIQSFVLEVGMAEKSKVLPDLARSYIEQGTLCVMTVDIRRRGEFNMTLAYSLYRRGKKTRPLTGIERWEVVESVVDIVPDQVLDNFLNLNVFDFFPRDVLEAYGLTSPEDPAALIAIPHSNLADCLEQVWADRDELEDLEEKLET